MTDMNLILLSGAELLGRVNVTTERGRGMDVTRLGWG